MKPTTESKIKNTNTLNEYLNVLLQNFACENCKPGRFVKSTLIYNITAKLSPQSALLIQAMKIRAMETENIKHFIEVIQANFNTNQIFTENAKLLLVENTKSLLLLTGLKENEEKETAPPAKKETAPPAKKKHR